MTRSDSRQKGLSNAERRAESEAKLIRAAIDRIAVHGYGGTTVADIGSDAGYSRGLVSQHFGSKIGLARALVRSLRGRFKSVSVPHLETVADRNVAHAWVDYYAAAIISDSVRYRAFLALQAECVTAIPELRPDLTSLYDDVRRYLTRRLAAAQSRGEVSAEIDVQALVMAILGMLRGTAAQHLTNPKARPEDLLACVDTAKAMLTALMFGASTVEGDRAPKNPARAREIRTGQ